jgi:anaerobic selenocysteine-containing dehydrogenase
MDHGGCALLVGLKDSKIVKVKGDPNGFLNHGYICPKALAAADRLTHPHRLKHPLKRIGARGAGRWREITWSEAIKTVSQRLGAIKKQYGAKGVAFCLGMPKGMDHFALIRLANLFGSPNVVGTQDVCHAPREVTGIHTCGFYPVADFHERSKLAILWGSNITATNEEGEICRLLLEQLKGGTELMVVDPRRTALVERAKFWLQLRPGTDHALALGFLHVILEEGLFDNHFVENWTYGFSELADHVRQFTPEKISEITWVSPQLIRDSARYYAQSRPAALQWGNAIEQSVHVFDTTRALICLMALCGNLDIPGGNIHAQGPHTLSLGKLVRADMIPTKNKEMIHTHHEAMPRMMTVPPTYFRQAVLEGVPYPVRGAYMQGTNPLVCNVQSPMTFETLMKLDFLVVADIFMTPTAAMADIVLPAATTFEFNDIGHMGLGHGFILARPKVLDPPEACWSDMKIINELGKTLTSSKDWYEDPDDMLAEVLRPAGLTFSQFAEKGVLKGPRQYKKYLDGGFKTATGKVELFMSRAEAFSLPPLPEFRGAAEGEDIDYPLLLTSRKSRFYLHSSYRWVDRLRRWRPRPRVEIHPETGEACGIREGDAVMIETPMGSIKQEAHLTDGVHPRVVYAAYGWWFHEGDRGTQYGWKRSNYNMLTSAKTLGKAFGTPNLKGINCRIRRSVL